MKKLFIFLFALLFTVNAHAIGLNDPRKTNLGTYSIGGGIDPLAIASNLLPSVTDTYHLGEYSTPLSWQYLVLNNGATDGGAIYFDGNSAKYIKSSADGTSLTISSGFTTTVMGSDMLMNNRDIYGVGGGNASLYNFDYLQLNNAATDGGTVYFDGGTAVYLQSNAAGTELTAKAASIKLWGNVDIPNAGRMSMGNQGRIYGLNGIELVGNDYFKVPSFIYWGGNAKEIGGYYNVDYMARTTTEPNPSYTQTNKRFYIDGFNSTRLHLYQSLGSECLTNGALTSGTSWSDAGDFTLANNSADYAHSTGAGSITQAQADLAIALKANTYYLLVYSTGVAPGGAGDYLYIDTDVADRVYMLRSEYYRGQQIVFKTNASPTDFTIKAVSTAWAGLIDTLSLKEVVTDNAQNYLEVVGGINSNGAQKIKRRAVGAGGTTTEAMDYLIAITAITGGGDTVTLQTADCVLNRELVVKDESGGASSANITIATQGAETIDGAATATISTNYGHITVYSNGSNWFTR